MPNSSKNLYVHVNFYRCFFPYKKEIKGELKGFENQILIKKGYNEHSIKIFEDRFKGKTLRNPLNIAYKC